MTIGFLSPGWEDYLNWQQKDKKMLRKIDELIKQCMRTPFEGLGKPEPLKENLTGWWSRRITVEHRLVYRIEKKSCTFFSAGSMTKF